MTAGHNNPPAPVETFKERIAAYEADIAALGPVTDDNTAQYADAIRFGGVLAKEIDKQRDDEKRPHLEAGRKIDGTYKPLVDLVTGKATALKKPLLAFQQEKEREARRIAQEKAEAARKAAEEAERAEAEPEDDPFLAATASPVDVRVAEAEAKTAEVEALAAKRIQTASSGLKAISTQTIRKAAVEDFAALAAHYVSAENSDLLTLLERLANADIRHAKGAPVSIPGVRVVEEQVLR